MENARMEHEGLINKRVVEGVQDGTVKEGQMADGSFVSVGDDGVARRLSKDGTPMTAARGKDGSIAGTSAAEFGMDAKDKTAMNVANTNLATAGLRLKEASGDLADKDLARKRQEQVEKLTKKFHSAKSQGANNDMLEMINDDIVVLGGKSLIAPAREQEVKVTQNSKELDADGKPMRTVTTTRKEAVPEIRYDKNGLAYTKDKNGKAVRYPDADRAS